MFKKIVFIIGLFFLFLAAKPVSAYTDTTPMTESLASPTWDKPSFDFSTVVNILDSGTALISGTGNPEVDQKLGGSALGGLSSLMGSMYSHPPASSVQYFADIGQRLKVVKPAYAQSEGFQGLRPILPVWKIFRDIAYAFFAIVFIITGFAIMFRVKLNPQTVISVQNALPKIIVALLLVTFSYAIAGLLVDLVYIINALGIALLNPPALYEEVMGLNIPESIKSFFKPSENMNIGSFAFAFLFWGGKHAKELSLLLNPFHHLPIPNISKGILENTIGVMFSPQRIVSFILSIVLLFTFFKLFLSLLKAYVMVIIGIIFGPIQIMLNAIPGQNSFGGWLRNLVANLSVFPVVTIMISLTAKITSVVQNPGISESLKTTGSLWVPSPIRPPVSDGAPVTNSIVALIAFGMLLITPKIAEIVKEALQIKGYPYGTAIGESFGVIRKPAGFIAGMGLQGITGVGGTIIQQQATRLGILKRETGSGTVEKKTIPDG